MGLLKKVFTWLVVLVLLTLFSFVGCAYWLWQWSQEAVLKQGEAIEFVIKPGSSIRTASAQLAQAGIPVNSLLFEVMARLQGQENRIKSGTYQLEPGKTPRDLLRKLVKGEFLTVKLTIVEGWTFAQMRKLINQHPGVTHETQFWSDRELLKKLGADAELAEGWFFPATYTVNKGSSDLQIYQQAWQTMQKNLQQAWAGRESGLPYETPYQALIMASIIEKETGHEADRDKVAAVFVNRLRLGMLLQTDPTVIYGMGERYAGKIRKVDLQTDTPYNTYTRVGLPPGPIALPGAAALQAALHPAASKALYFVARGDGTSQFSESLEQHNQAVDHYIRGKGNPNRKK